MSRANLWTPRDGEPVEVATDYGSGYTWTATATATPEWLTSNYAPEHWTAGLPDWATYPDDSALLP